MIHSMILTGYSSKSDVFFAILKFVMMLDIGDERYDLIL